MTQRSPAGLPGGKGFPRPQRWRRILMALMAVVLTGCGDDGAGPNRPPVTNEVMQPYVTGNAAAALDATGHFQIAGPPAGDPTQIDRPLAERLAVLDARQWGPGFRQQWEKQRGGPIDITALRACGTTRYAESAFGSWDPAVVADPRATAVRRVYGPWWIVFLCGSKKDPQVIVAVSALSTDLTIEADEIVLPPVGGEWFVSHGVPPARAAEPYDGLERAVQRLAQATGRRVREVPVFVSPLRSEGWPTDARLRLVLDGPGTARRADQRIVERETFYWSARAEKTGQGFEVAADTQPADVDVQYPGPPPKEPGPWPHHTTRVTRQSDVPLVFEAVTIGGGE
jgi:hypothetical protein